MDCARCELMDRRGSPWRSFDGMICHGVQLPPRRCTKCSGVLLMEEKMELEKKSERDYIVADGAQNGEKIKGEPTL